MIQATVSDFHADTLDPAWSIVTNLTGLMSFILEKNNTRTLGSVEDMLREKEKHARDSLELNLMDKIFCEVFPAVVTKIKEKPS